jgi:hypothetical protein
VARIRGAKKCMNNFGLEISTWKNQDGEEKVALQSILIFVYKFLTRTLIVLGTAQNKYLSPAEVQNHSA